MTTLGIQNGENNEMPTDISDALDGMAGLTRCYFSYDKIWSLPTSLVLSAQIPPK